MKLRLAILALFVSTIAAAQYTQQLRGTVVDQVLQKPLPGATVILTTINRSTITDEEGNFRFTDLPIGSYRIAITYLGFKELVLENISVQSGKETVMTFQLETQPRMEEAVVLKVNPKKNKPINDMSAVSARAFTVAETQRYAAAVNDPLRMAAAFPGVLGGDDGGNQIIIRGNSPAGLLWRMEGMDIPNPNHFGNAGSTGGGISILSAQLLSNSDFVTAAFAPEYGNALSGVFDLHLRKGNNEKKEYALQAGILGLNGSAEGPFSKNYKGSYLVNYRYSTLQLLNKVGVLPDEATTNFQDLSYNIYLPTKKLGQFTLFGFGGLSKDVTKMEKDASKWEDKEDRYPSVFTANTGMSGITHNILLGNRVSLKTAVGISYTSNKADEDYIQDDFSLIKNYKDNYNTRKLLFTTSMNYKINSRLVMRAGLSGNLIRFRYYQLSAENEGDPLKEVVDSKGNTSTHQGYLQWQYKPTNRLTVNGGVHYLHLDLNNSSSVEPRASVKWAISNKSSIAAGYGLHSQVQAPGVYFARQQRTDGSYYYPNRDLGFTKSHHYVLSYNQQLTKSLLLKTEIYYQQLMNVPVGTEAGSTFSTLNIYDEYITDALINKGKGKNYGVEISLERYLRENVYFMLTNSIYQSKYKALDGIERNTRYNGSHITTFIAGKDFVNTHKARTFGVNIKTIYAGGVRTTPIDLPASQAAGYVIYKELEAYTLQNPDYFRTDLRVSITWNRSRLTSTLSLDVQNLTNRENVSYQYFDSHKNNVKTVYQTGLIPVLNYKIEF